MKIYSYRKSNAPLIFNIEVVMDDLDYILQNPQIIAGGTYKGFQLPNGPVISQQRNLITSQMISDYECFVEDIEILCEENFGLILTYSNESKDLSHYYNFLATNDDGDIIAKFRFRLRISNHKAHRTKEQQRNKKLELQSPVLKEKLTSDQILDLATYSKDIIVNDETFQTYEDAFDHINNVLKRSVEIMRR